MEGSRNGLHARFPSWGVAIRWGRRSPRRLLLYREGGPAGTFVRNTISPWIELFPRRTARPAVVEPGPPPDILGMTPPRMATAVIGAGPAGLLFSVTARLLHRNAGGAAPDWSILLF